MNAYILCGGQSKRMGRDKALLPFRGIAMAQYISQSLYRAGFSHVYAVVKETLPLAIPQIMEPQSTFHPLFGVHTALEHSSAPLSIITPCDLPFVSEATFERLRSKEIFTTTYSDAQSQPLLGIFPKTLAKHALHYAEQSLSVMNFVKKSERLKIPKYELVNINTPQNLKENQ